MLGSLPRISSCLSRSIANHIPCASPLFHSFRRIGPPTQYIDCPLATFMTLPPSSPSANYRHSREFSTKRKGRGRQSYRFVDRTRVQVSSGSGGNGSTSMFHIGRKRKRRPDGGHGGNGGSVLIIADPKEQSLRWTRPHISAESGSPGGSQGKNGRNGKNAILRVPCGVVVRRVLEYDERYDDESNEIIKVNYELDNPSNVEQCDGLQGESIDNNVISNEFPGGYLASLDYDSEEDDDNDPYYDFNDDSGYSEIMPHNTLDERTVVEIADLDKPGSHVVVAKGGRGGYGNISFASRNAPLPPPEIIAKHVEPKAGETCRLELELKLIADIGLVGYPNAGKSSLLSATSRATPYIAPYPFTTLNPLVGYIEYRDGFRVCAADVPGLIAGASEGRGKGHDFLRHLERTKALLYIVDAAGIDGRDPIEDFEVLTEELSAYGDGDMLNRRCLVVANKVDLLVEDEREEITLKLQKKAEEVGIKLETGVLGISAGATGEGLKELTRAIRKTILSCEQEKLEKGH